MTHISRRSVLAGGSLLGAAALTPTLSRVALAASPQSLSPTAAQTIAKNALIYGFPMVAGYGALYEYCVDQAGSQYKGPLNEVHSEARVMTPADTAIITPNSDTPYSVLWADLRAEPLVLSLPAMEKNRYFSVQFIDLYTWNFDYAGSRTTGNGGGKILLVGPRWKGSTPKGITKVVRSDTDFALAIYRTQLFDPKDIENVKKVQAGYTAEPLSKYSGTAAPAEASKLDFPAFSREKAKSAEFFDYMNFVLQFCPTIPADAAARKSFAQIGVVPGKPIDAGAMSPQVREAIGAGMLEGMKAIEANLAKTHAAANLFGTREFMKNNYLNRATGAMAGLYGNSKAEAYYFAFYKDSKGTVLDGSKGRYTMHFDKGDYPPVNAFWSVTLYDAKTKLLSANPIDRYLINSPMLPNLKLDSKGGLTVYLQKDSPGKDKEANWLPAPDGEFFLQFRCYGPKQAVLDGKWTPPAVTLSA